MTQAATITFIVFRFTQNRTFTLRVLHNHRTLFILSFFRAASPPTNQRSQSPPSCHRSASVSIRRKQLAESGSNVDNGVGAAAKNGRER